MSLLKLAGSAKSGSDGISVHGEAAYLLNKEYDLVSSIYTSRQTCFDVDHLVFTKISIENPMNVSSEETNLTSKEIRYMYKYQIQLRPPSKP